jgi:hypothetical protein
MDCTDILTDDEIQILKKHNAGPLTMEALALRGASTLYARGREFVSSVRDLLYSPIGADGAINPIDREVQILTMLTISREWRELAIHCYWALLVDLHPRDVAQTLLLASMWAGIDEYVTSLGVFTKVMQILKELAPAEPTPEDVLARLLREF